MINAVNANGVKGCLLLSSGSLIFRVYHDNGKFTDYSIAHSDLQVTINDNDAYFYKTKQGPVLDHSPNTLGYYSGDDVNET